MEAGDDGHVLVLALSERLYICSRLLTRAAERLGWDSAAVQELVQQLRDSLPDGGGHAGIEADGGEGDRNTNPVLEERVRAGDGIRWGQPGGDGGAGA